jgi:single-strand DNA-binding protein
VAQPGGLGRPGKNHRKIPTKGSEVAVEGKLTHCTYEDKDGNKKYFTEIVLHDMVMLHTRNNKEE